METFIIIGVIVGIIGLLILYGYYLGLKRRNEMTALSLKLNLPYLSEKSADHHLKYAPISIFQKGHSQKAANIIGGQKDGLYTELFDYQYTTGSGKNQSTHHFSICILTLPQSFKYIHIRSEGLFDKLASLVGFNDLDFNQYPEFSKRFWVKSADEEFARVFVSSEIMQFLTSYQKPPHIEIGGNFLAVYFTGGIKPDKYQELYEFARAFYQKMTTH
ncbi:MAG: hypothetical protein WC980_10445 [Candidatus Brocadiia bacterium]